MNYKEIVDYATVTIGTLNYPMFGNFAKKYTHQHLKKCIDMFPKYKVGDLTFTEKTKYLGGILKLNAKTGDYKNKNTYNLDGFKLNE